MLYLENNLAAASSRRPASRCSSCLPPRPRSLSRIRRLYRDLAEREAKIRRLVDANIIGIFIWDFDGRILEANERFFAWSDTTATISSPDRLRWTEITPAEWRERDAKDHAEHKKTGRAQPFEKEYSARTAAACPC